MTIIEAIKEVLKMNLRDYLPLKYINKLSIGIYISLVQRIL